MGTLALCYGNVEVFRGVVKLRRGETPTEHAYKGSVGAPPYVPLYMPLRDPLFPSIYAPMCAPRIAAVWPYSFSHLCMDAPMLRG